MVLFAVAGGLAKGMGALLHNSIHAPMNSVSKGKPVLIEKEGRFSNSFSSVSWADFFLDSSLGRWRANSDGYGEQIDGDALG